jgi:hypothetical protein
MALPLHIAAVEDASLYEEYPKWQCLRTLRRCVNHMQLNGRACRPLPGVSEVLGHP